MKVKIKATTVYAGDPEEYVTIQTVDVPSPGEGDPEDWANDYLLEFTGTGRTSGTGGYFVEVLECGLRPDLVGTKAEAYG